MFNQGADSDTDKRVTKKKLPSFMSNENIIDEEIEFYQHILWLHS